MKRLKPKIILVAILLMMILLISTKTQAMKHMGDGYGWHYTKDDISWTGTNIKVNGNLYWCINHNYTLTGGMAYGTDLKTTDSASSYEQIVADPGAWYSETMSTRDALVVEAMNKINARISGANRTATISAGTPCCAKGPLEAAIYAFANGFDCSNYSICHSIWRYEHRYGGDCGDGEYNYLWAAANAYQTWGNPTGSNGTYYTQNQPNLDVDSSEAKADVNYNDSTYVIGPLKINYDAGGVYSNGSNTPIRFTKNLQLVIKDQEGNIIDMDSLNIVDELGNKISGITKEEGYFLDSTGVLEGEEFFLKFPYTRNITHIDIDVSVEYIKSIYNATRTDYETTVHVWKYFENTDARTVNTVLVYNHACGESATVISTVWDKPCDCDGYVSYNMTVTVSAYLSRVATYSNAMQNMRQFSGDVEWGTAEDSMSVSLDADNEMEIAGYVWKDIPQGKDSTFNGSLDENDTMLYGIEVRLYEYDEVTGISTLAKVKGTNPTLTDENGHYSFTRVDPTKKYYVVFTYNGMIYTNTYGAGKPDYNTDAWNASSKGAELISERQALNKRFVEIGSYPVSYLVTDPIFGNTDYLETRGDGKYYNEVFKERDIAAYQSLITEYFAEYLESLKDTYNEDDSEERVLDDTEYREQMLKIYKKIAGEDEQIMRILQYIWDCRINSYGGYESIQDGKELKDDELYPYYDRILLADEEGNRLSASEPKSEDGYWYIYNGQLHVNQGLIVRNLTNLELTEDLYKTVISINEKDETYKYGSLDGKTLEITSADRMQYTQNIVYDDYNYNEKTSLESLNEEAGYEQGYAKIQVYVTYKMLITNRSNIPASVKEIVTYFDREYYSYSDSYTTTEGNALNGIEATYIKNGVETSLNDYSSDSFGMSVGVDSIYGDASEKIIDPNKKIFKNETDMYISFEDEIILENEEALAIYLTYRLGENSTKDEEFNCTYNNEDKPRGNETYVILQDLLPDDNAKINIGTISEIHGFETYYRKDFDAQDTQTKYSNDYEYISPIRPNDIYRAAGVLDSNTIGDDDDELGVTSSEYKGYELRRLSIPGNLTSEELNGEIQREDDWDNASTLIIDSVTDSRRITGNVWDTGQTANYYTENSGEYAKYVSTDDKNTNIKGITVELIEIKNGAEHVRAITETKEDGSYEFTGYIPGDYVVRFTYGDKAEYSNVQHKNNANEENNEEWFELSGEKYYKAYNGQFYQSTKANPNTNETQYWYVGDEADNTRYSDAYDEVNIRKQVNSLLLEEGEYVFSDVVGVIKNPQDYMVYAYTSMLELEVEKAKTETSGEQTPGYTISNVDFGLTPRTEAELKIDKKVTHLKLIKQNGVPLFDVDTATIRAQGVPGVQQATEDSNILISLDNESQNGATLEITYTITVTNMSKYDSVTYYKNQAGEDIALGLYRENVKNIVYYEDNQVRRYNNYPNGEVLIGATTFDTHSSSKETVTTTSAKYVADFISNNLNFAKVDYTGRSINEDWDMITLSKDEFAKKYYTQNEDEKGLQPEIADLDSAKVYESNVIVEANSNNPLITTELRPQELGDTDGAGESVSTEIVLSKVISANSDSTDTKSYNNTVRILQINNTVSRIQEMPDDEDILKTESEKVIVTDPTGLLGIYMIIALVLVVSIIIGGGIFLIKKFVMPRR